MLDHQASRRSLIKQLGLGAAAAPVLGASSLAAAESQVAAAPAPLWSAEYGVKKGDVSLYVYRKRAGAPQAGEAPRPVLFLVHGSSMSARSSFDLTVPG